MQPNRLVIFGAQALIQYKTLMQKLRYVRCQVQSFGMSSDLSNFVCCWHEI